MNLLIFGFSFPVKKSLYFLMILVSANLYCARYDVGDLLFQNINGQFSQAVEQVTGSKFSHVGIVSRKESGELYVIEAFGKEVSEKKLEEFLRKGAVVTGQIKDRKIARLAVRIARKYLGVPYDPLFVRNNGGLYCSELIYEIFREANNGVPYFQLRPMTFMDANGEIIIYWENYFRKYGTSTPEGEFGISPGDIAKSSDLISIRQSRKVNSLYSWFKNHCY